MARGDLSQKITVDARGDPGAEVDGEHDGRPAVLVRRRGDPRGPRGGHRGKLGVQAQVRGVSGTWRDLTESVNQLAGTLTTQLRAISAVSTAVARGDLTQQIQVAALGEVAELKDNINQMIAALRETTAENASRAGWTPTSPASGPAAGPARPRRRRSDDHAGGRAAGGAQVGTFFLAADPGDLADSSAPACWVMCAGYAVPPPGSAAGIPLRRGSGRPGRDEQAEHRRHRAAPGLPGCALRDRYRRRARSSCSPSCSRASHWG